MTPLARVVGFLIVVLVASCALPPRVHAADVILTVTDGSAGDGLSQGVRFYEQTVTGVVLVGLGGRWTLRQQIARGMDADGAVAGFQVRATIAGLASGVHTFVATAYNTAGESGGSNTVAPNVPAPVVVPANPTGLIFEIVVP